MINFKSIFATVAIAAAVSPALAATDGLPPNLEQRASQSMSVETATTLPTPQFLHGQGEVSLVPNPEFRAASTVAPVRMGRITPPRSYVGA